MIYEIALNDKQKNYLNYFIYAIKEELDSGADGVKVIQQIQIQKKQKN